MINTIKERILQMRLRRDEDRVKTLFLLVGILLVALLLDVVAINIFFIKGFPVQNSNMEKSATLVSPSLQPLPTSCADCVSPRPTLVKQVIISPKAQQNAGVKDYFIPLGTGTNQTIDWTDVSGAVAAVDFGRYESIKEVRFEASVNVPSASQIVWVRLFNKTDKHPVWYSEVSTSNSSAYLTSVPLIYDTGEKEYQVQMKTQLQGLTNLNQARIHVILW